VSMREHTVSFPLQGSGTVALRYCAREWAPLVEQVSPEPAFEAPARWARCTWRWGQQQRQRSHDAWFLLGWWMVV